MLEIKLFQDDDGSVILESKNYGDDDHTSFTVQTDARRQNLNKITTVKDKMVTLDLIAHLIRYRDHILSDGDGGR